jgi:hypothetical protein
MYKVTENRCGHGAMLLTMPGQMVIYKILFRSHQLQTLLTGWNFESCMTDKLVARMA